MKIFLFTNPSFVTRLPVTVGIEEPPDYLLATVFKRSKTFNKNAVNNKMWFGIISCMSYYKGSPYPQDDRETPEPLVYAITIYLYHADPMGIGESIGFPEDEYEQEAKMIIAAMKKMSSDKDLPKVIHKIFVKQFSAKTAGDISKYETIAKRVWELKNSDLQDKHST